MNVRVVCKRASRPHKTIKSMYAAISSSPAFLDFPRLAVLNLTSRILKFTDSFNLHNLLSAKKGSKDCEHTIGMLSF